MNTEKKDGSAKSSEKCEKIQCKPHRFIITGWLTKGGFQNATTMRCCHCMFPVNLEQLESQEWRDKNGF